MFGAWAMAVAEAELSSPLPRRWAHTQGVAERAKEVRQVLGVNVGLLLAAAALHDVGYAPRLAATGFHPLDGARFLRDEHGAEERLVRLVANHSFAHVGKLHDHTHRMGLLLAARTSTLTDHF
ncbi:HD domain-containing protein [Streptomyces microflavus]|uniref:HD domain-containing protein n=1 Tax=Streptomyces microflavus TaxID=1919 RepID=UPI003815770F